MTQIYYVQDGDTITAIANKYNISKAKLERDNDLSPNQTLVVGQTLIIAYPEKTYIIKQGDTLSSISKDFNIPIIQLLRNNPYLSDITDQTKLDEGDEIIISYPKKEKKIKVNGFANSFIRLEVLRKTLPFLTYITILNYRINEDGSLVDITDTEVIRMAKEFGVAPLMFISTLDERGMGTYGSVHNIINNIDIQNALIENTLTMLTSKGFYGLYIGFQHVLKTDMEAYAEFVTHITHRLNDEGYPVFISLIPVTFGFKADVPYQENDFSLIGNAANFVTLITYQWTSSYIPQFIETSPIFIKKYVDFAVSQIPPEKIFIELSRIAYDWELPYVEGGTLGRFTTNEGAVDLARQLGAVIQLDEATQTPFYYYSSLAGVQHLVWFKNSNTFNDIIKIAFDYNLQGVAIWNIMYYYNITYLLINSQYDIETVLNESATKS